MAKAFPLPSRFRGRPIVVSPGETLVQALSRPSLPILQRSIRYHRPRAPFCGIGHCTQCLVNVNGRPNVRACRYFPQPADIIETENAWPSPNFDVLGVLDFVFYHGLDTMRGFRRPRWATPLYHRIVRRLAGYGQLPQTTRLDPSPTGEMIETDCLVVGAGASGQAAASRLAEAGAPTVVIDRDVVPTLPETVRTIPSTTAIFLPPPGGRPDRPFSLVAVREPATAVTIHSRAVIVATGSYDASLLFSGNDRPGVITADAAFRFSPPGRPPPFRRAVIIGGGERAAEVLDRFGDEVEAIVAPGEIGPEVVHRASGLEIPLYPRSIVESVLGRHQIRSIVLQARGGGERTRVSCDAVVLSHRRLPNPQLYFQAGARMHWRSGSGAYFPELDDNLGTSVPGLFAAGESAGFYGDTSARTSGRAAAEAAVGLKPKLSNLPERVSTARPHELESYYRELLRQPRPSGKWVACSCEDVLLDEVEDASNRGYRGIEVIKRYTSLGTGICQGRYCLPDILLILSILEKRPPSEVGYITQRPPVVPATLGILAALPGNGTGSEGA